VRKAQFSLRNAGRAIRDGYQDVLHAGARLLYGGALRRYARATPEPHPVTPRRRVVIVLASAWGMGGTIRAAHNLAGYLADTHEVEILSVFRRRDDPAFPFPANVKVTALNDDRPGRTPASLRLRRTLMKALPSALVHPADRSAHECSLWTDFRLAQEVRGRSGFLIGTRPGINLAIADLSPPGFITIGEEQINLAAHAPRLRNVMKKSYPALDVLVTLTEADGHAYEDLLGQAGKDIRRARIPNTAHALGGADADLEAKTVLAAGRLTPQKGFDMLIRAWAQVAPSHPDWKLRICGSGERDDRLARQVAERELWGSIEMPGARDLSEEMANASIFVLSSRYEGFPLVLLEAMSKSLAVVSFDCPTGPSEVIEDHQNGLLVPARDVDGLAAAITELIEDASLRRRLGPEAGQTALEYTIEAIGPRWEALFDELAEAEGWPVEDLVGARESGS
jgi:glycosyltransferase involved in cell wall biosynthesis